jgi:hypothetical protein
MSKLNLLTPQKSIELVKLDVPTKPDIPFRPSITGYNFFNYVPPEPPTIIKPPTDSFKFGGSGGSSGSSSASGLIGSTKYSADAYSSFFGIKTKLSAKQRNKKVFSGLEIRGLV